MAASDIRREHVLAAVAEYDRLGQEAFLEKYDFGKALTYRLVYDGKFYDSKAIAGVAHGFATGEFWTKDRVFGGKGGTSDAVPILENLGFYVDSSHLFLISRLRVNTSYGKRAAYQYVVLLWAYARARDGLPRLVPFNDVRDELAELLAPFALAATAPDPAMPWAALGNLTDIDSGRGFLWDADRQLLRKPLTDADVKRLNIVGGLSQEEYGRDNLDRFLPVAVEVIGKLIGDEPAYRNLLGKLGLTGADRRASAGSPFVEGLSDEAADAVEAAVNPRRKFGRRLSAAENKAIEEHAVKRVREHLETVRGYKTDDVGSTESYDVHATRGDEVLKVEVKGTTTDGSSVTLTYREVELHQAEYPNTALAVVRRIVLDRSGDKPVASGGVLEWVEAWPPVDERLKATVYSFQTGL
jgi:hypothetical protein